MTDNLKSSSTPHPSCDLPVNDQRIYRYMDLWKFIDLLQRKSLYFCRADKLQDEYEGTYSRFQIEEVMIEPLKKRAPTLIAQEMKQIESLRKNFFINCWCMSEIDTHLMWKTHIISCPGLAIQSTYHFLRTSIDMMEVGEYYPIEISIVKYYDQIETGVINWYDGFDAFVNKDVHFHLDNELRALCRFNTTDYSMNHIYIEIHLSTLIESIIVSPGAPGEFVECVRNLMINYGLKDKIVKESRYDQQKNKLSF